MSSGGQVPTPRLTTQQADALARRQQMTRRRNELSQRIRKQKKSAYLAQKRGIISVSSSTTSLGASNCAPNVALRQAAQNYLMSPSPESFDKLYQLLQQNPHTQAATVDSPLVLFQPQAEDEAKRFLQCLYQQATSDANSIHGIVQVLLHLAAITVETPSFADTESDYYGNVPSSWSILISESDVWRKLLISFLPTLETASFVVGNIVSDAGGRIELWKRDGLVEHLVGVMTSGNGRSSTAAWVLTTAIRNDPACWASSYCGPTKLNPTLLCHLLLQQHDGSSSTAVATQASWMVVSLTQREVETIHYLAFDGNNSTVNSALCSTLLQCWQSPSATDQRVPVIQAFGNIASSQEMVGFLLESLPAMIPTAIEWLSTATARDEFVQTVYLVGCLLVDAGNPHHAASRYAPGLLNGLFQELSARSSLDEQRELVCAIWNGLARPPDAQLYSHLSFPQNDVLRKATASIVRLTSSVDVDAQTAAVNVIELLMEHPDRPNWLQNALEELDIGNSLEEICNKFSEEEEELAEVAADLLDDYFCEDKDEGEGMDVLDTRLASGVGKVELSSGMGRGRGRGAVIPSWMSQGK